MLLTPLALLRERALQTHIPGIRRPREADPNTGHSAAAGTLVLVQANLVAAPGARASSLAHPRPAVRVRVNLYPLPLPGKRGSRTERFFRTAHPLEASQRACAMSCFSVLPILARDRFVSIGLLTARIARDSALSMQSFAARTARASAPRGAGPRCRRARPPGQSRKAAAAWPPTLRTIQLPIQLPNQRSAAEDITVGSAAVPDVRRVRA
jgi:hypothetical protein